MGADSLLLVAPTPRREHRLPPSLEKSRPRTESTRCACSRSSAQAGQRRRGARIRIQIPQALQQKLRILISRSWPFDFHDMFVQELGIFRIKIACCAWVPGLYSSAEKDWRPEGSSSQPPLLTWGRQPQGRRPSLLPRLGIRRIFSRLPLALILKSLGESVVAFDDA